jgi:galactose mutarotase-like enzyme
LFPIVGELNGQTYRHNGQEYHMSRHGFARDMVFRKGAETDDQIWFILESNEETKKSYPFDFNLAVRYRLRGRVVEIKWIVMNKGEEPMYFSIGGHPAFRCPLGKDGHQSDYYLSFDMEGRGNPKYHSVSRRGLYDSKEYELPLDKGLYRLERDTFKQDTMIFEKQTSRIYLMRPNKRPYITVTSASPLFGIWSPPGRQAPFVCIEPWYGRCDREGFGGELSEKDWIQSLQPKEVFEAAYYIEFS